MSSSARVRVTFQYELEYESEDGKYYVLHKRVK